MKLALDGAPLLGDATGVGVFAGGLLANLASHSALGVVVYALSGRGASQLASKVPPGVDHVGLPMPARPLLSIWQRFSQPTVERWTGPVDVVHGTNFVVPPTRSGVALVTVHDLTSIRFPELCSATTLKYPALVRSALARNAHVHVPTAAIAGEVKKHFDIDAARIHTIAPGITEVGAAPVRSGSPYVLALGTIEPRKNYPLLIAAFEAIASEVPEVELWIAGGRGWGIDAFDAALSSSKVASRIKVLGRVDSATRADLLRNASALAYPSVYEGFGLPPLEAMSVGVPVVSTDVDAVVEVCGDAALFVKQNDVEAMAKGLQQVLTDESLRRDLIAKGTDRAAKYSWQRATDNFVDLYSDLVEAPR